MSSSLYLCGFHSKYMGIGIDIESIDEQFLNWTNSKTNTNFMKQSFAWGNFIVHNAEREWTMSCLLH